MNENEQGTAPVITHDEELALHIRLASGGKLTLAVAENAHVPAHILEKAGIVTGTEWTGAHDYASTLGGNSVHQNEFTKLLFALRQQEAKSDPVGTAWKTRGQ